MGLSSSRIQVQTIRLRCAERADAPLVLWLEEVCTRDYAIALWGNWRASATLETIDLANHWIIDVAGQSAGCAATAVNPDHFRINKLYLAPDFRNRGVGAQVLRQFFRIADEKALPVKLSVLTTNPAVRFYEREGFAGQDATEERRTMIRLPAGQAETPRS